MMTQKSIGIAFFSTTLLIILGFFSSSPRAQASANDCLDIMGIYARGSGESLNSDGWRKFRDQLKGRLGKVHYATYQLGSESQKGYQYPAVNVSNPMNGNAIGAWLSAGYSNDYGDSVNEGFNELISYMIPIHGKCPDTRFVLAGYSQGAHVIGMTASAMSATPDLMHSVEFVALFGDPKLNLPEGRGFNPPACRGEQLSSYRREVPNCDTDDGSLGARDPYLPDQFKNKTGLWCNDSDFVCGSSKRFWATEGHGQYAQDGGAIDDAVLEIATKLVQKSQLPDLNDVSLAPDISKIPQGGPDVMFLIDNSPGMIGKYISLIKPVLNPITEQVVANGGRVGIRNYDGCGGKGSREYYTPLTSMTYADPVFLNIPQHFTHAAKPTCSLSSDLMSTIEEVKADANWNPNRKRIIIPITNEPFSFLESITPVAHKPSSYFYIYPAVPDEIRESFDTMSVSNTFTFLLPANELRAAIEQQATNPQIKTRLAATTILAHPGESIMFDASSSTAFDDSIIRYDWDFNNDGSIDESTTQPIVHHIYQKPFAGRMRVIAHGHLTSDEATASVSIKTGDLVTKRLQTPTHLFAKKTGSSTAQLNWHGGDPRIISWLISLNGVPIGKVDSEQTHVNIRDLRLQSKNTFSVQGIAADGEIGDGADTSLAQQSLIPTSSSANTHISMTNSPANNQTTIPISGNSEVLGVSSRPAFTSVQSQIQKPDSREPSESSPHLIIALAVSLLVLLVAGIWRDIKQNQNHPV